VAACVVIILFLFPLVSALWMAVICLWLVDAGNNTAMEPYRALISDRLKKIQIPKGFLIQSMFTGAGAVLANVSLFVFQKVLTGASEAGVPYWVFVCFLAGSGLLPGHDRNRHDADQGDLAERGGAGPHPDTVEGHRRHGGRRRPGSGPGERYARST
jgi:hypothetical protein